ncbi:hypothetical protein diail_8188 [Diaporthe ilicicola]|nr:hypothetical protein diail_8188 [Diaporthe ilicicola]
MAADLGVAGASDVGSEPALPDGLGPIHVAVLKDDYAKVRELLGNREVGVDCRTAIGSTPLMLAALYGRHKIFEYLWIKNAYADKKDYQDRTTLDYIRSNFAEDLRRKYKHVATSGLNLHGQGQIIRRLKAIMRDIKRARTQVPAEAQAQLGSQQLEPSKKPTEQAPSGQTPQAFSERTGRTVFIRSLTGRHLEYVELRPIASTEVDRDLERKSTAVIHGLNEDGTPTFAVSGWGGIRGQNVLDNKEYTSLVRRTCAIYGFHLPGNWLDYRFAGDPAERKGAFVSCHAEKQLGVHVLLKSLSFVLGIKAITKSNLEKLLQHVQLQKLPARLSHTIIELDHKPCKSCLDFLNLLRSKAGLVIVCKPREWYTHGWREQLRYKLDGSCKALDSAARRALGGSDDDDMDVIEDEIDGYYTDSTIEHEPQGIIEASATIAEGGSTAVRDNVVPELWTPSNRPAAAVSHLDQREPYDNQKRGSPVWEMPDQRGVRYAIPPITPPSHNPYAMPTPQSLNQSIGITQLPVSPIPIGLSSALGSEDHMDRETPTMSLEYELEEILDTKEEDGRLYLVKWKDYPHENNSWEPEGNLINASGAISKFWQTIYATQALAQETTEA